MSVICCLFKKKFWSHIYFLFEHTVFGEFGEVQEIANLRRSSTFADHAIYTIINMVESSQMWAYTIVLHSVSLWWRINLHATIKFNYLYVVLIKITYEIYNTLYTHISVYNCNLWKFSICHEVQYMNRNPRMPSWQSCYHFETVSGLGQATNQNA